MLFSTHVNHVSDSPTKALAKLLNRVGFNASTLLDPTLFDRFVSLTLLFDKVLDGVSFDQTLRPTILLDSTMLQCFAAPLKKLFPA